jgi:NTP pyrophosphatase (non-canonical NTP hydrolase)
MNEPGRGIDADSATALVGLVYELLDAHEDTAELADGLGDLAWELHLDYLRTLQRRGRELLARATVERARG